MTTDKSSELVIQSCVSRFCRQSLRWLFALQWQNDKWWHNGIIHLFVLCNTKYWHYTLNPSKHSIKFHARDTPSHRKISNTCWTVVFSSCHSKLPSAGYGAIETNMPNVMLTGCDFLNDGINKITIRMVVFPWTMMSKLYLTVLIPRNC